MMIKLIYGVTVFYRDHNVLTVLELDPLKSMFSLFYRVSQLISRCSTM